MADEEIKKPERESEPVVSVLGGRVVLVVPSGTAHLTAEDGIKLAHDILAKAEDAGKQAGNLKEYD